MNEETYIVERLSALYTADQAREWLASSQPLLGGAIPRELIAQGRGDEVKRLVWALTDGIYL